eukprot:g3155.t1 g3155   contig12:1530366-1533167(+)
MAKSRSSASASAANDDNGSATSNQPTNGTANNTAPVAEGPNPPGMVMRSGRKKRRGASSSAGTSDTDDNASVASSTAASKQRRSSKRRKLDDDESSVGSTASDAESGTKAITTTKRKSVNGGTSGRGRRKKEEEEKTELPAIEEKDVEMETVMDESGGVGGGKKNDVHVDTEVNDARKNEVVVAAAAANGETASNTTSTAAAKQPSPAAPPLGADTLRRLVTHGLRLPSQHTPKSAPGTNDTNNSVNNNEDGGEEDGISPAVPPGGRRLVFDTTAKKSSAVGGGGKRNKLLMQIHKERGGEGEHSTGEEGQEQQQQSTEEHQRPMSPPFPQRFPHLFIEQITAQYHHGTLKKEVFQCTLGMFIVFLSVFVVVNLTSVISGNALSSAWDVKMQSMQWKSWYGINNAANQTSYDVVVEDVVTTVAQGQPEQEVIEKIVEALDPKLLEEATVKLQAERLEEHKVQQLKRAIEKTEKDMQALDAAVIDWTKALPHLSDALSPSYRAKPEHSDVNKFNSQFEGLSSGIFEKYGSLSQWEAALNKAEEAMEQLTRGNGDVNAVNDALDVLSRLSLVPASAKVLDVSTISIIGEGCEGKDYIPENGVAEELKMTLDVDEEDEVVVVGGIDVEALDNTSDAPVRNEDAQNAYMSLMKFAQSSVAALVGAQGPSALAQRWVQQLIKEELKTEEDHESSVPDLPSITDATKSSTASGDSYTARDAIIDIDRRLEIEDADRTGKFDYASVIHGARVLRRGPRATSLSLYETLPLLNRFMAYTKLRFYGHPAEVALRPTTPMHARGQCWSFQNEYYSRRVRQRGSELTNDGYEGEYATLSVSLSSQISVSEVVMEHLPSSVASNANTAVKDFRLLGYEDVGAYGEPVELGTFQYDINGPFSMQTFTIPQTIDGMSVPKLKAVSLAVDTNWGADYTCLYRFRVHGY